MSNQFRPRAKSRNRRKTKAVYGGYRPIFDGAVRDAASRLPNGEAILKSLYVDEVGRALNDSSRLLGRQSFGTPGQRAAERAYRR